MKGAPVPGNEQPDHAQAAGLRAPAGLPGHGSVMASPHGPQADQDTAPGKRPESAAPPGGRLAWLRWRRLTGPARRWLAIFTASLVLFLVRFLVPVPVGQADNRDGPRLMCALGLGPITHGYPRYYRFAYFDYVPKAACAGRGLYPSSELVPLLAARVLTPLFALPGSLSLIVLGVLMCAAASVGIASLAVGLRIRLWAQLLVAAVLWLIMADAAFFDVFASPFSEPAALAGLLLVAAGVLYLGRGWRSTVTGLILAGSGGFLAILSKEQYLVLAVPICVTLVLASSRATTARGRARFRNREVRAAASVAAILALLTGAYAAWNYSAHYGRRLQHIQAVDMIFTDIVTTRATAPAQLRALGLPASWARYAGLYYWHPGSVRTDPLLASYDGQLTDTNIAHYLITHPASIVSIGQQAATQAQLLRVTTLGDYPPGRGYRAGSVESRVTVVTWLAQRLPARLGLLLLIPLWAVLAAIGAATLRLRRGDSWQRDGAVLVLCMTGCAMIAFIPPAYFAGISTTRHMVGSNLATLLALTVSGALVVSMGYRALARRRARGRPGAPAVPQPSPAEPVSPGPA